LTPGKIEIICELLRWLASPDSGLYLYKRKRRAKDDKKIQTKTIPADFDAIEEILMRIGKSAIGDKPCHIAPGINLPFRRNQTMSSSSPT